MNPPRWDSPSSEQVREELLRRVAAEQTDAALARPPRTRGRNVVRLAVALVIALALVVPASILAFHVAARPSSAGGGSMLAVATDVSYSYDPRADYAGVVGVLHASRTARSACFWVTATETSGAFGAGSFFLVFPADYSATPDLELLDGSGVEVAAPGDAVTVSTTSHLLGDGAEGCSGGPTLGALHLERTVPDASTSTPSSTSTRAAAAGCAPTSARIPSGASTATIADVDGDGRPDTEWAELTGGDLEFGITTASGATVSGSQGFAGGGSRSFVVGKLANGVVVAITSEGRDSPVYTFSGCAFHPLLGADLIAGTDAATQFTFSSATSSGAGGCFGGRLAILSWTNTTGDTADAIARYVDVSADGRHSTLTDETATVAKGVDYTTDPAEWDRFGGISCGASKVLVPTHQG